MLKKSLAWLLTVALCMSVFAGCGAKKTLPPVNASSSKVTEDKVEEKPAQASDTLVVTTAGAVTPAAGIKHVIIEADGVILENAKLETITVSEKLGDGTATLKNVKAKILNANGGGEHSIIILDSDLVTVIANRKDGKQHITINVGSTVKTFTIESEVIADIEGAVEKLVVEDKAKDPEVNILASSRVVEMLIKALTAMQIDAEVESVSITGDAENSTMEVGKGGKVGTLATDVPMTTSGEGAIGTLVTNNKNNLKGSTLAANTTTINQNPLNKNVAEAQPIVKKKPGAVTPPPAADEAPVSGKIELTIIGAEAFPKPYDGTDIAYVTGVDFANLQNGDALHRGRDYTLNAKFEDVNIGKNKKIIGTVALLPTEKTAKYNLKDGNLVNVAADITKGIPKNEFTDLVTVFSATVPYSASIDLSKFFKKGAGAGAESYEVAAQSTAKHSSGNAANLVVTKCGAFKVAFKTAATDKYDEHRIEFTLTVSKAPGTAIAEKLVGVKPTTINSNDGKITGLDSKKLYEYKTVYATTPYTAVAANATEITGLGAGEYTVRYKGAGSDIKDEGIGTEITITNPKTSQVSFAAMAQTETVLGKLVSALQSADTETVPDGNCSFKGELNKIDSWPEFDSTKTGYFVALQVNPQAGTAFTDAAELKLYNSGNGALNGTASLKTDNKIVLHVADSSLNPNKEFKVTIDLDGAGTEYEATAYQIKTGGLTLAANNAVELTVKVDGAAADVAGIGAITIQKGTATPIALTEEGTTNVYKNAIVPTGEYKILVGGVDTRQTLNVNQATSTTGDLLYYTVTLNAPTGVTQNSSLKASYGAGVDIPTKTPLLKDTEITLTAAVEPPEPNTTYTYAFSDGATTIAAVAGAPTTAKFVLTKELDANVAITATVGVAKIAAVADLVVAQPVKNVKPANATVTSTDYAVTSTVWNVAGENGVVEATAFQPGTSYTATVTLTAAAGKTFSSDIVPTGTLTGANAILKGTIASPDVAENTIVFKITYPALAAAVLPTATVAVTGNAKVGATLTAKATIVEGDFTGTTVTYKWYRSADATIDVTDTVIDLVTAETYVLTAADHGQFIYCEVTPNNGGAKANSAVTAIIAKGDSTKTQPTFIATAPVANTDVQVTTAAGATLNTTTLSFVVHGTPANTLANLEFKFAASSPEVTDAEGWTEAAATKADVAYTTGHKLYIRAKADATAQLNPSVATECAGLVINVLTAQQNAINTVKVMFDNASTLTIDMLNTATGTATATADNLVAYKAAVEACTAATELDDAAKIAAIVTGVNDAVAAIESNTSVTVDVLKKATGLATINNYTACEKVITAAPEKALETSALINAMVGAVEKMETAVAGVATAEVANTVVADAALTETICGKAYTVSAPVITTNPAVYLRVVGTGFQLKKVNDTAADVTEAVTFTWTDKTLTYITHELVPCTVTIKQTAKGLADADIAAAKLELEKDVFYTTISMANGEVTATTTTNVQALVTNALATTLKNTTCTVTAEATGNVVRVDGTKLAPTSKDGVYKFKVKITKANGAEQTTKVMTITTAAIAYAVNDITETALTLTAPDSANAAAVTAPTGIANCTCDAVVWTDDKAQVLATGSSFVSGTVYTATFTLTASDHYKFPTTFAPTCTVSGATVTQTITGGDVENNTCEVKITFPAATGA